MTDAEPGFKLALELLRADMAFFLSAKNYFKHFFAMWQRRWPKEGQFIFMRLSKEEYKLIFFEDHPDLFEMPLNEIVWRARGFGVILKSWRLTKKMTQEELSAITGIARSNICAMERGRRKITEKNADRIGGLLRFTKKEESDAA